MAEMQNKGPYTVVSLFSGCGGLDLGFLGDFTFLGEHFARQPFEVIWANDLNPAACRTYRANIEHEIICGDVWDELSSLPDEADVVIGGFPCQDVSVNGKGQAEAGSRTILYKALIAAIKQLRPKVFVAENVKGLLMNGRKALFEEMMCDFNALKGYDVTYQQYHAADYGIPQSRERLFFVGSRLATSYTHPVPPLARQLTAREAIADLESIPEDPATNHIWSRAQSSPEQGNRRLNPDRPAPTVRAECHGNSPFHYSLPRRISMREAARFQSFPDDFIFQAKLRETERQVGNAVPPVLAWHLARSVKEHLET